MGRGWRFKCGIDASANLPSLASGFPRPPLGGGGRPSGNDGLGIFAAPTVTAALNSAARKASEGRKTPGAVIPCGWKTRKRSDYVFLRYGIQSLYIGATRNRTKAKTLDARLTNCGRDGGATVGVTVLCAGS